MYRNTFCKTLSSVDKINTSVGDPVGQHARQKHQAPLSKVIKLIAKDKRKVYQVVTVTLDVVVSSYCVMLESSHWDTATCTCTRR